MWKLWSFLVLCSFSEILGVDLHCPRGSECKVGEECPGFKKEKSMLDLWPRGSPEFNKKLREIKKLVCNKKLKKVCCKTILLEDGPSDPVSWVPSLRKQECGISTEGFHFVRGGTDTKLGEFPWNVLLGKTSEYNGQIVWYCGGTLINRWYVLSAAHCGPEVHKVRVGEWKVDSDNVDCICGTGRFCREEICANKHQDIQVSEVKIHESFRIPKSRIAINDIMLVKLKYPVNINKYASPICLPDEQETKRLQYYGEQGRKNLLSFGKPIVVGWGNTLTDSDYDSGIVSSAKQQQLAVPVVSNQRCADKYTELFNKFSAFKRDMSSDIRVGEHLCAGGEEGKDSCEGDSGGPLIGRNGDDNPYILVGVVSSGTKTCGIGAPGLYTRVTHYMEWILKNMR